MTGVDGVESAPSDVLVAPLGPDGVPQHKSELSGASDNSGCAAGGIVASALTVATGSPAGARGVSGTTRGLHVNVNRSPSAAAIAVPSPPATPSVMRTRSLRGRDPSLPASPAADGAGPVGLRYVRC